MGEASIRERIEEERDKHYAVLSPRHVFGRGYETECICGATVPGEPDEYEWEQHIKIAAGWSPTRDAFERGKAKGRAEVLDALDDPAVLRLTRVCACRAEDGPLPSFCEPWECDACGGTGYAVDVAAVRRHLAGGQA